MSRVLYLITETVPLTLGHRPPFYSAGVTVALALTGGGEVVVLPAHVGTVACSPLGHCSLRFHRTRRQVACWRPFVRIRPWVVLGLRLRGSAERQKAVPGEMSSGNALSLDCCCCCVGSTLY